MATAYKPRRRRIVWEDVLAQQLALAGFMGWKREYVFHPTRKWRFDLAFEPTRIAVEVEGFGPRGRAGRHQRAEGFTADCAKYAEATILGWRVIRVTTAHVRQGAALAWIQRAMESNT